MQNKLTVASSPTTNPAQVVDAREEEVIYAVPGPPTSKSLSAKSDGQYYNLPLTIRTENQSTDSASLVTGSLKPVNAINKKPATTPKPSSKENPGRQSILHTSLAYEVESMLINHTVHVDYTYNILASYRIIALILSYSYRLTQTCSYLFQIHV